MQSNTSNGPAWRVRKPSPAPSSVGNSNNTPSAKKTRSSKKRPSRRSSLRRMRISKEYDGILFFSIRCSVQERMSIQQLLLEGQIQKARQKLDQMDPLFLEKNAVMDFLLAKQELIELIKARNVVAALGFATKNLAPFGEKNPQFLQEIEHTMALLAFENHTQSPLGYLLEQSQRRRVADEVNSAILRNQKQELGMAAKRRWRLFVKIWANRRQWLVCCDVEPILPTMVRQFRYMEDQLHMKIKHHPKGIPVHSEDAHDEDE
ncbi:Glucose-induced degradation protein 8, partial [Globisporangium splendens]